MTELDWHSLGNALREAGLQPRTDSAPAPVGGGDINEAWLLQGTDRPIFLKTAGRQSVGMFEAEAAGLKELAAAKAIRVPEVLAVGQSETASFLALEWLNLTRGDDDTQRALGHALAALHRCTHQRYGWSRDNTIGRTPQINAPSDDWPGFFREHRLDYQLRLAASNGFTGELQSLGERLSGKLGLLVDKHTPPASLLHGDLWGGNWSCCNGEPVIFDPAVYYGDRETDLAMTRLFGGFGSSFYDAYAESWPLPEGHEQRVELYQLYHVLNHLNLFGSGYLGQAVSMMRRLLR